MENTHDQHVANAVDMKKIFMKITQSIENTHDKQVKNTVEVEKPKIIMKTAQPIENTHDQHVTNTVEVEKHRIIMKITQPPGTRMSSTWLTQWRSRTCTHFENLKLVFCRDAGRVAGMFK